MITPIGRVRHHGGEVVIGDGEPGPVGLRLRAMLTDIQRDPKEATANWILLGITESEAKTILPNHYTGFVAASHQSLPLFIASGATMS